MFRDYPPRIYLDGQKGGEQWATIDSYKAEYENTMWKNIGVLARKRGGHGGMDFILVYRLMDPCARGLLLTWTSTTRLPGAPLAP